METRYIGHKNLDFESRFDYLAKRLTVPRTFD